MLRVTMPSAPVTRAIDKRKKAARGSGPPSAPRRRLDVDVRRGELLELGLDLFAKRAYDDVSLDDIARRARISKGLLYHYFPGKRDFYVASLELASERLLARTETDPALPKPLRLAQGLDAYLAYVEGFGASYAALLKGGVGSDAEAGAIVEHAREVVVRRVLDALGVGEPRPALRLAVRGWLGFVEATSLEWLAAQRLARDKVLEMMMGALVAALELAQRVDPGIAIDLA